MPVSQEQFDQFLTTLRGNNKSSNESSFSRQLERSGVPQTSNIIQGAVGFLGGKTGRENISKTIEKIRSDKDIIRQQVEGGEITPSEGLIQKGGISLAGGGEVLFEGLVKPAFKLILPKKAENYIEKKSQELGEKILDIPIKSIPGVGFLPGGEKTELEGEIMTPQEIKNQIQEISSSLDELPAGDKKIANERLQNLQTALNTGKEVRNIPETLTIGEWWNNLSDEERVSNKAIGGFLEAIGVGRGLKSGFRSELPEIVKTIDKPTTVAKNLNLLPEEMTKAGQTLQKMHRILPTDASGFSKKYGVQFGDYLVERGIIDTPEKTIQKLFDRFMKSKSVADEGFAAIDGNFNSPVLRKVADELLENERNIAKAGAASKEKKLIEKYIKSLDGEGLTMTEINNLKRIYDRKIKTEFIKDKNKTSTEIQGKTNLSNNLREWQRDKAKEIGFNDLVEINRETQMAKDAFDALSEKYLRKQANNAVSLTDWVVATGTAVNPSFLAALIGKKGISSDTFQATLAKFLGKDLRTIGEPELKSLEKIQRKSKILEERIKQEKSAQTRAKLQKEKEKIDQEIENNLKFNQLALPSGEGKISSGSTINVKPIIPRTGVNADTPFN